MSTLGLFLIGLFVTLLTAAALGLLVYGAILDGRDEAARKRRLAALEGGGTAGPTRAA